MEYSFTLPETPTVGRRSWTWKGGPLNFHAPTARGSPAFPRGVTRGDGGGAAPRRLLTPRLRVGRAQGDGGWHHLRTAREVPLAAARAGDGPARRDGRSAGDAPAEHWFGASLGPTKRGSGGLGQACTVFLKEIYWEEKRGFCSWR